MSSRTTPPVAPAHPGPDGGTRRAALLTALVPAAVLVALATPALLAGPGSLGELADTSDEALFHFATAARFAEALPAIDFSDYPAATTPLHHLMLAVLIRLTGGGLAAARLGNLAVAVAAIVIVTLALHRRAGRTVAWALVAPLATSPYWVGPAVRVSTDDAALLWVFLALISLGSAAGRTRLELRTIGLAAAAATAAALTRQLHVWLVVLLALAASWPGPILATTASRRTRLVGTALAVLPVAAIAPFLHLWHGPVPPMVVRAHQTLFNPVAIELALSVLGLVGAFYLPALWGPLRSTPRAHAPRIALVVVACWAMLALFPLPWRDDPNHIGGALWTLAARFPDLAGSALPFWGLLPLGGVVLYLVGAAERRRGETFATLAIALFVIANAANARAYQKYYEPFLLFALAWVVSRDHPTRWALLGPAVLAVGFLAVDAVRFTP